MPTVETPTLSARTPVRHGNPWPGLAQFTEPAHDQFKGRDDEVEELLRRVSNARLTVLFGKSGLGKSSLVQAGLFPRLREVHVLPVLVRLRFRTDQLPLIDQFRTALLEQLRDQHVDAPPIREDEGLWEYLHRRDLEFWSETNRLLTPLFVLDQFEELFTLGEQMPEAVSDFRGDFGNLAENGIPRDVANRCERTPGLVEALDVRGWRYGVLVCLREDFLPQLEGWRRGIASLGSNRMRLLPMKRRQAFAAVHDVAPDLVDDKLAWQIVNQVSAASWAQTLDQGRTLTETGKRTETSLFTDTGPTIEPALLSLFCAGLYQRRLNESGSDADVRKFDETLLEGAKEAIIEDFYRDCIKGLPDRIPAFIADQLITDRGFRNSYPAEDAIRDGVFTEDQLQYLINRRLLRLEQQHGLPRIELTHDILTRAISDERSRRQFQAEQQALRQKAEEAENALLQYRSEQERKQLQERSRRQQRFVTAASIALVVFGTLSALTFYKWRAADYALQNTLSGKLALQAVNVLEGREPGNLAVALLLGVASFRAVDGEEALDSLRHGLESSRGTLAIMDTSRPLTALAFSPDGSTIAAASRDKTIALWNVASHRMAGKLEGPLDPAKPELAGHRDVVNSVAFSPDGRLLASSSRDNTVILWDVATRTPVANLGERKEAPFGVAFSGDGKMLAAAGGNDRTVSLWDVKTRKSIATLGGGHSAMVFTVAFSPDAKTLASAGMDKTIRLWDLGTRKSTGTLEGHTGPVLSVAFSPDGKTLASASRDKTVIVWDLEERRPIGTLSAHKEGVRSVAFSQDGSILATAGEDNRIALWNATTREPIGEMLAGHTDDVVSVAFSPDGRSLASASRDKSIVLWDLTNRSALADTLVAQPGGVLAMAYSPDGSSLATAGRDKTIHLWDTASRQMIGSLTGHEGSVTDIAFSADGRLLASASRDQTIRLWDVAGRVLIVSLAVPEGAVNGISFSPNGKLLASAGRDKNVVLWDVAGRARSGAVLKGHGDTVSAVAFSPDGKTLASAGRDRTIRLWDVATWTPRGEPMVGHDDDVTAIAFSRDGRTLASAGRDDAIVLWDSSTRQRIGTSMRRHKDAVRAIAFNPDGTILASAGDDRTIMLWNVSTRVPAGGPLQRHSETIRALSFSPDGRTLASGSEDATVALWNLDRLKQTGMLSDLAADHWLDTLCGKLTRNLSKDEWQHYAGSAKYVLQCHGLAGPGG